MAYILSDNILSPLGETSQQNYEAVKNGRSALAKYPASEKGVGEDFCASLFSEQQNKALAIGGLSPFEAIVYRSAEKALIDSGIIADKADSLDCKCNKNVVLIMSTTKGNADLTSPAESARKVSRKLGLTTRPIVVCNACISGLASLILGKRLVDSKKYDYAIVCGADRQGQFIISGFQSLKALSPEMCRPFDIERLGLNLGEAAAAVVIGREPNVGSGWNIVSGAVRNDAYHVSAPSKKGDGLYLALKQTIGDRDTEKLAFVNAHGTATMFNDQMESVALERAGLTVTPVNALKGYYGHTMGAAGLLELIISMKAADDNCVLATRGYEEIGVSGNINITSKQEETHKQDFLKMLSGFGGCNAVVWASKSGEPCDTGLTTVTYKISHRIKITPHRAELDGKEIELEKADAEVTDNDILTALYKQKVGGYPKFYKMDKLCRLGFLATELLLKEENLQREKMETRAVVFFNHSSSVYSDRKYMQSIADADNYFPSPSIFVYTLPNIVTGEVAMRNNLHGETSFYLLDERDDRMMDDVIEMTFCDGVTESVIGGWIDYEDENNFIADIKIMVKE